MRRSFLLLLLVILPAAAFSEIGIQLGIGPNVTFPSADLGDFVATGFGGTAMAKVGLIPMIEVTGGLEYIKFTSKDITVAGTGGESEGNAWGYFVGGRANILLFAYAGLELGGYSFTSEFTAPNLPGNEGKETNFFFAPMIGAGFGMFDANVRYVVADGNNFWSLRGMVWFLRSLRQNGGTTGKYLHSGYQRIYGISHSDRDRAQRPHPE
jgi:hypothetical protein